MIQNDEGGTVGDNNHEALNDKSSKENSSLPATTAGSGMPPVPPSLILKPARASFIKRLSGTQLLSSPDNLFPITDEAGLLRFNELLERFPIPPHQHEIQKPSNSVTSHKASSNNNWGVLKGLADRFSLFPKG